MGFWGRFKKFDPLITLGYYTESFGQPDKIYECNWLGETIQQVQLERIQIKKNGFYVLQFPPQNERPVWTYITLGMSSKAMVNGKKVELIWLNQEKNKEIQDLMVGLTQYPFVGGIPYDYGHTISNSEPVSAFRMNTILVCPPIIEAADSTELMNFFEKQKTELLWLLPIHPSEKEYIRKNENYGCFFDLWLEKDMSPEIFCNPNRSSFI